MAAKKAAPRTTRTRADVQDDFDSLKSQTQSAEAVDRSSQEAARQYSKSVLDATSGLTLEKALHATSQLSLSVQQAFANAQQQVIAATEELTTIRAAVDVKRQELEDLHKIDTAAAGLDLLLQTYEEKEKALETEYEDKKESLKTAQADAERSFNDLKRERQQVMDREKDVYLYTTKQARDRQEDEHKEKMIRLDREAKLKTEELERIWNRREADLTAKEAELTALRAEVAGYPEKLKAEVTRQSAITSNAIKTELTHQFQLAQKDSDASARIQVNQLAEQAKALAILTEQNTKLQTQLEAANTKIENIATKAIDGASSKDAFDKFVNATTQGQGAGAAGRAKA